MSGSSGGGFAPEDNSLAIAQMQYRMAQEDRQRQEREEERDEKRFITNRDNAYTAAQGTGRDILTGRGLNADDFMSIITRALDDTKARVPQGDPNPASYFTTDVINNALTGEENQRRIRNTSTVNQEFAPGFDRNYIPDTADDSYINELLSGQRANADRSLEFARSRGQLNDSGYNTALAKVGEQETGARSTLDSLGGSVLAKNRAGLSTIRDSASTTANQYSLGGPEFDINPFKTQLTDAVAGYNKNLKGDLTNALGGTQLFNINDILLAGARAQGPQNLTTAQIPGLIPKKNPNQDRGLGSSGVF